MARIWCPQVGGLVAGRYIQLPVTHGRNWAGVGRNKCAGQGGAGELCDGRHVSRDVHDARCIVVRTLVTLVSTQIVAKNVKVCAIAISVAAAPSLEDVTTATGGDIFFYNSLTPSNALEDALRDLSPGTVRSSCLKMLVSKFFSSEVFAFLCATYGSVYFYTCIFFVCKLHSLYEARVLSAAGGAFQNIGILSEALIIAANAVEQFVFSIEPSTGGVTDVSVAYAVARPTFVLTSPSGVTYDVTSATCDTTFNKCNIRIEPTTEVCVRLKCVRVRVTLEWVCLVNV